MGIGLFAGSLSASPTYQSSVLNCKLEYQRKNKLNPWNATGEQGLHLLGTRNFAIIKSTVYKGHTVSMESFLKNGKDHYSVSIRENDVFGGKEIYTSTSAWNGLSVKIPVDFVAGDEGEEDPPEMKLLLFTCDEDSTAA